MKKLLITTTLVFAALLMTSCRKSNVQPVSNANGVGPFGDYEMTLNTMDSGDEKSSIEGFKILWQLGDKLYVVDETDGLLGYLTATTIGNPANSATFKGFITKPTVGSKCRFYFVGRHEFNIDGSGNYLFDVSEQYGGLSVYVGNVASSDYDNPGSWKDDIDDISNSLQLMKSRNAVTITQTMLDAHNFGNEPIHMHSMVAIARIDFRVDNTPMGGELSDVVTVNGAGCYSTARLNIRTGELTPVAGDITLKKANGNYFMVLIPANQGSGSTLNLTFTADGRGRYTNIVPTVAANKFYNVETADVVNMTTPLYLSGDFSVAEGVSVKFSKGNLYWDGSKFRMEANQWNYQPSYNSTWTENKHISHFFWSNTTDWQTSGKEPYAARYSYSTKTVSDNFFTNATLTSPNPDFAVEGESNTWRTLSRAEWDYLIESRTPATTTANFKTLTVSGTKSTVSGLVLLPDNSTASLSGITTTDHLATNNAVFLPAAGLRINLAVEDVDSKGQYWLSAPEGNKDYAWDIISNSGSVGTGSAGRGYGFCVRLVRYVPTSSTPEAGDLNGGNW